MGVGCGYRTPSADLVTGQGLEVTGCGSGSTRDEASAGAWRLCWVRRFRLRAAGLGLAPFGVPVPVGVRVGVHWLLVCFVHSRWGSAWYFGAIAGWVAGFGGGAAGQGVTRVVLCAV